MKVDIIMDRKGFDALSGEWNELLGASACDTIFLTWEFISTWRDVVRPQARLLVVVVRNDKGRLVALAPLYHARLRLARVLGYRCLRMLGDYASGAEYMDMMVRRGSEEEAVGLVVQALREQRGWDCMWLPSVADWTGASARFRSLGTQGAFLMHFRKETYSAIRLPDSHEQYLQILSGKQRGHLRREARDLNKSHTVRLVRCEGAAQLPGLLEALFLLHAKHWNAAGEAGSFMRRPAMKRFYEHFAPVALRWRWLRLFGLEVDGAIRAAQYGYAYKGKFLSLQEGFDPEWPRIGHVLRDMVIKACIEEGIKEYDFLGEFTEHKRHWRAEPREGCALFLGRRSIKNALLFVPRLKVFPTGRYLRPEEGRQ